MRAGPLVADQPAETHALVPLAKKEWSNVWTHGGRFVFYFRQAPTGEATGSWAKSTGSGHVGTQTAPAPGFFL
jgi:hypothetical protein